MKTFQQFLEATEGDLRSMGASEQQVAELKRRQAARAKRGIDKGFTVGDDRNKKTTTASASSSSSGLARRGQKALPPASKGGAITRKPRKSGTKGGQLATRPAEKGSAMIKKKKQKANAPEVKEPKKKRETIHRYVPKAKDPGRKLTEPTGGDLKKKKKGKLLRRIGKGAAGVGLAGLGLAKGLRPRRNTAMPDGPGVSAQQKDLVGNQEIRRGERK